MTKLNVGCYFGEKALLTSHLDLLHVLLLVETTTCVTFSKANFDSIACASSNLIGCQQIEPESRSLCQHIERVRAVWGRNRDISSAAQCKVCSVRQRSRNLYFKNGGSVLQAPFLYI